MPGVSPGVEPGPKTRKSGLFARTLALEHDLDEWSRRSTIWYEYYQPQSPPSMHLVNESARATLLADRCDHYRQATIDKQTEPELVCRDEPGVSQNEPEDLPGVSSQSLEAQGSSVDAQASGPGRQNGDLSGAPAPHNTPPEATVREAGSKADGDDPRGAAQLRATRADVVPSPVCRDEPGVSQNEPEDSPGVSSQSLEDQANSVDAQASGPGRQNGDLSGAPARHNTPPEATVREAGSEADGDDPRGAAQLLATRADVVPSPVCRDEPGVSQNEPEDLPGVSSQSLEDQANSVDAQASGPGRRNGDLSGAPVPRNTPPEASVREAGSEADGDDPRGVGQLLVTRADVVPPPVCRDEPGVSQNEPEDLPGVSSQSLEDQASSVDAQSSGPGRRNGDLSGAPARHNTPPEASVREAGSEANGDDPRGAAQLRATRADVVPSPVCRDEPGVSQNEPEDLPGVSSQSLEDQASSVDAQASGPGRRNGDLSGPPAPHNTPLEPTVAKGYIGGGRRRPERRGTVHARLGCGGATGRLPQDRQPLDGGRAESGDRRSRGRSFPEQCRRGLADGVQSTWRVCGPCAGSQRKRLKTHWRNGPAWTFTRKRSNVIKRCRISAKSSRSCRWLAPPSRIDENSDPG